MLRGAGWLGSGGSAWAVFINNPGSGFVSEQGPDIAILGEF